MAAPSAPTIPLLPDLVVLFALAVAVAVVSHRFRVPAVVGFLFTGVLAGPHTLGLVHAVHEVEALAEIGVVLLLFTIGVELSLSQLGRLKRLIFIGGGLQTILTIGGVYVFASAFGFSRAESIVLGFLISLSSTAIVLKLLHERMQLETAHGKAALGILIFQDLIIVPMMLVLPFLSDTRGAGSASISELLITTAAGIGFIALVVLAAYLIVPRLLFLVAGTRSQEVFLMSVTALCFSVAMASQYAGLSLALGAFAAGLLISESEYSHQAFAHMLPFRDMFTSLFFISVGMLLSPVTILEAPATVLALSLGVVALKAMLATVAGMALGLPIKTAIVAGLSLAQVGEFSFVLSNAARELHLMSELTYQYFLSYAVISMCLTPAIISWSPAVASSVARLPWPGFMRYGWGGVSEAGKSVDSTISEHLIIVGMGVNGQNLALAADEARIPYMICELNVERVRIERALGRNIIFGDASQEAVLLHLGIKTARVLVVAISDPVAARGIVQRARRLNPRIHIIVRTRLVSEMQPLYRDGANDVIPEEFETSVELFSRVLGYYLVPRQDIEAMVARVRGDSYEIFRTLQPTGSYAAGLHKHIRHAEIASIRLDPSSPLVGIAIRDTDLRGKYGVNVLVIERTQSGGGRESLVPLDPATRLEAGDVLIAFGPSEGMARFAAACVAESSK